MGITTLLKECEAYLKKDDLAAIRRAYEFAKKAHKDQKRKSGAPYITHPVATAQILTSLHTDVDTLIAALLHDVPEDTHFTLNDIKRQFGDKVAFLVNGITKMSTVYYRLDMEDRQIESLKKLMIHCAQDTRVILIKLADRLHNMRTLHFLPPEKRARISRETLEIYVPIANLLGIGSIKSEIEDLCFKNLFENEHDEIAKKVTQITKKNARVLEESIKKIKKILKEEKIQATVIGRQKNMYSIFKKIKKNQSYFAAIEDIIGLRIIVPNRADCYAALGIIHSIFKPKPRRFKDYIAVPKINGYQSIHTTVFGINGIMTEIQIRSAEMDLEAQFGIAAHYFYKISGSISPEKQEAWAQKIIEIQKNARDNEDLIENLKIDIFQDRIFVFTPKGDVVDLPSQATGIDFAFAIHSEIGKHAEKVEINGEKQSLFLPLTTGDTVKIITNSTKKTTPTLRWLQHCKTNTAKKNIKEILKKQTKKKKANAGKELLRKEFSKQDLTFDDLSHREVLFILSKLQLTDIKELYVAVGEGTLETSDIISVLHEYKTKPSLITKLFSYINKRPTNTIGLVIESKNMPLQVTKIVEAINTLKIPIIYLKTRAKKKLKIKVVCKKVSDVNVRQIFDRLEQVEGITNVRRTFPKRMIYFYGWSIITAVIWGSTPFILKFLSEEYFSEQDFWTHQAVLYGGIFVLFAMIFHLKRMFYRNFPGLRDSRGFWITSFGIITIGLAIIIGEILIFNSHQLNWVGILAVITLVYTISVSEYISYNFEK